MSRRPWRTRHSNASNASATASSTESATSPKSTPSAKALVTDLAAFYRQAAGFLAHRGWIANPDNLNPPDPWRGRLRSVLGKLRAERAAGDVSTHVRLHPSPLEGDHLAAIRAAGLVDNGTIWRSFETGLVVP